MGQLRVPPGNHWWFFAPALAMVLLVVLVSERLFPLLSLRYNDWIYRGRRVRLTQVFRWTSLAQCGLCGVLGWCAGMRCGMPVAGASISLVARLVAAVWGGLSVPRLLRAEHNEMVWMLDSEVTSDALFLAWQSTRPARFGALPLAFRRPLRRSYLLLLLLAWGCAYALFAGALNQVWGCGFLCHLGALLVGNSACR